MARVGVYNVIRKTHLYAGLVLLVFVGIYAAAALCWIFLDPRGQVATREPVA